MIRIFRHLALAGLIIFAALAWARYQVDPSPYDYDEADYMYAASRGLLANWSDTPALTLFEFVQIGLTRGSDPSQKGDLSVLLRDSGDMDGYRHWHGPLYYYGLALAPAGSSEYTVRRMALAAPLLGMAVVYLGCLWLFPAKTWGEQGTLAAVICSLLFLWCPAIVKTTEIAPHILFSAVSLATLFAGAKLRESGRRGHWYAMLALSGVAFCTMELSFALILSVLIVGHLERDRLLAAGNRVGFAGRSLAAFLAPIVLLWPAALYKFNFIKSYLFMAYLAVFRKNAWGDVTFAQTWTFRLKAMPVEWVLIAVAIVLFFRFHPAKSPFRRQVSVFLIFAVVMLAAVLRCVNARTVCGMRCRSSRRCWFSPVAFSRPR